MCECGCGEMNLIAALAVDGTENVLAVDEYWGCEHCANPLGITLRYFDRKGQDEWLWLLEGARVEALKADEDGGKSGYGWWFPMVGQAELVAAAREDVELKDLDLSEYANLGDLLAQYGQRLLRAAMRRRKKEEAR